MKFNYWKMNSNYVWENSFAQLSVIRWLTSHRLHETNLVDFTLTGLVSGSLQCFLCKVNQFHEVHQVLALSPHSPTGSQHSNCCTAGLASTPDAGWPRTLQGFCADNTCNYDGLTLVRWTSETSGYYSGPSHLTFCFPSVCTASCECEVRVTVCTVCLYHHPTCGPMESAGRHFQSCLSTLPCSSHSEIHPIAVSPRTPITAPAVGTS